MARNDNTTRDAALKMLKAGLASPSEVASLAGVSRQLVNFWMVETDIDWRPARAAYLERAWRAALKT